MLNIYCDESCHLENDNEKVMAIGGIVCSNYAKKSIYEDIKKIKIRNNIPINREIKWNKVSKGELNYYKDLINYFFSNELLRFRAVLLPDKSKLRHNDYCQTHDDFYYKMYFYVISYFFADDNNIEVYIDIKDTNSSRKIKKLQRVLNRSTEKVTKIQKIRSHENSILQLTDLILGAVTYINRNLTGSEAKLELSNLIQSKSEQTLKATSYFSHKKINLLVLDKLV